MDLSADKTAQLSVDSMQSDSDLNECELLEVCSINLDLPIICAVQDESKKQRRWWEVVKGNNESLLDGFGDCCSTLMCQKTAAVQSVEISLCLSSYKWVKRKHFEDEITVPTTGWGYVLQLSWCLCESRLFSKCWKWNTTLLCKLGLKLKTTDFPPKKSPLKSVTYNFPLTLSLVHEHTHTHS